MNVSAPKPRVSRMQFSLRGLLILMAVVSVALVAYRWPWEVFTQKGDRKFRTQYRRAWNGRPVKSGLERVEDGILAWNVWYDEVDRRREQFFVNGKLNSEENYLQGKLDGPIRHVDVNGPGRVEGQFRAGQKVGVWKRVTEHGEAREQWQANQRQGEWTWKSSQGKLLQSAEFEKGELVRWNDRPLGVAVRQWLEQEVADPELRRRLLLPLHSNCLSEGRLLHYGELLYQVGPTPEPLIVTVDMLYPPAHDRWHGRPFVEALMESALSDSNILCLRYGVINVVAISQANLKWRDRTGVDQIQFAAGSPQEQEWLGNSAPLLSTNLKSPVEFYQRTFGGVNGSSINADFSAFGSWQVQANGGARAYCATADEAPRLLRDRVAQYLNRQGYYCERRDNTIVIKPHPETVVAQYSP
jgi:hypothetical protein